MNFIITISVTSHDCHASLNFVLPCRSDRVSVYYCIILFSLRNIGSIWLLVKNSIFSYFEFINQNYFQFLYLGGLEVKNKNVI